MRILSIYAEQKRLAIYLGFIVLRYHSVVHGDPRVLKTHELDELVLIHVGVQQPNMSMRSIGNHVV